MTALSGMKDGAAAIEQKTGIGAKADAALKDATGKSGGDLFEQAKTFATENKMAAGGALGGLGLLLLGTRGGRGLVGSAATLGGLAMVGGLAYKAWQNHQAGNAPATPAQIEAAPDASPFGVSGNLDQDNATAMLVLRAMIAAAACDGVVDNAERSRIIGALEGAAWMCTPRNSLMRNSRSLRRLPSLQRRRTRRRWRRRPIRLRASPSSRTA